MLLTQLLDRYTSSTDHNTSHVCIVSGQICEMNTCSEW